MSVCLPARLPTCILPFGLLCRLRSRHIGMADIVHRPRNMREIKRQDKADVHECECVWLYMYLAATLDSLYPNDISFSLNYFLLFYFVSIFNDKPSLSCSRTTQ